MDMNENQNTDLEYLLETAFKSTNTDKNYNAIKGVIGLLPAGSSLAEFYSKYVKDPAQERLRNFLGILVNEFKKLENEVKDFSIESLESNPLFTTLLIRSFEIVRRTHQEEKILVLNNLLLNSVLLISIKDDLKLHFLDLVDTLKVSHFSLLLLAEDYTNYDKKQSLLDDIETNKALYSIFLKRLISEELMSFDEAHIQVKIVNERVNSIGIPSVEQFNTMGLTLANFEKMMASSENIDLLIYLIQKDKSCITDLGALFVKFIKSPLQNVF